MRLHHQSADEGTDTRVAGSTTRRSHTWAALGALLIIVGATGSILAAHGVAHSTSQRSQKTFTSSSEEIAATLKLSIQHEDDLVFGAQAFVLGNPKATESQFIQWAGAIRAMTRYPELLGFGATEVVPASQLAAFAAHQLVAPSSGLAPAKTFTLVPPGNRPFYCLSNIGLARNATDALPPGYDLCAGPQGSLMLLARDSGQTDLQPFTVRGVTDVSIAVPIYRGKTTPSTVAGRRSAFVGWVGLSLVPHVILETALAGHPNTEVGLRFGTGASSVEFRSGRVPVGAQTATINLHNGWTVETFGVVASGGVVGNGGALGLLIGGIALSFLLSALIYALGTGRARSVLLVAERTDQLRFQALHDSLTELPNRALIMDRIELMLARARRNHLPAAVMFLDLDDFKDINDTLGHPAGDELLIAVGARLAGALREGDSVGRLGGDEFVLLIEGASLPGGVEVVAERILDVLRPPFDISQSDLPLSISASIGIALGDRGAPEELLRDADIALYRAKAAGKKCAVVFAPAMQAAAEDHRALGVDLHGALDAQQFFLLYQPTIDLQTNAFTGVEALLRWNHPDRGVIQPDDFIPALESSGLIVPVGAWVLNAACRQGAAWHALGHTFTVSVNVSGKQLDRDRIVDDVQHALSVSGFDPTKLLLELTETSLTNNLEDTITRLTMLKALGVRLAVDDFGTGYSSLSYLRKFPLDVLKIDRSFVSGIADSAEASALVHTLVQLGKVLNLETIAEGIEDDDQRARLQAEAVDTGQGFLFSRPLDVTAIDRFLEDFVPISGRPVREKTLGIDALQL